MGKNLIQRHIIYFLLCKNDHGNYIFAYYECFGFCELWEDWVNLTLIYVGRWIIKNHNKLVKDGDFCRQWLWTLIFKKVGKLIFSYCWVIFTLPIIIQLFKFDFFYYLFFINSHNILLRTRNKRQKRGTPTFFSFLKNMSRNMRRWRYFLSDYRK